MKFFIAPIFSEDSSCAWFHILCTKANFYFHCIAQMFWRFLALVHLTLWGRRLILKYVEKIRLMLLWLSCHFQRWGFVCQGMGRFGITHAFLFNTCGWLTLSALIPSQRCLKGKVIDLKIQRRLLIKQHSTWWYILRACALYFQTSWINLGECMPLTGVHKSNYPVVRMPDWPWLATHNLGYPVETMPQCQLCGMRTITGVPYTVIARLT